MYWADSISEKVKEQYKDKIKAKIPLIIRDEKTLSGRVHVGSLRGLAIHGIIEEVLKENKIPCKYLFEFNDFDPMDGLPVYEQVSPDNRILFTIFLFSYYPEPIKLHPA